MFVVREREEYTECINAGVAQRIHILENFLWFDDKG